MLVVRMAWHDVAVGDVEGPLVVVDTGDVGGDGRVWLLGGCHGLWVARDVCGAGGYVWAMWWQVVVEVVVVG